MVLAVNPRDIALLKNASQFPWVYIGSYKGLERVKPVLEQSKRRFIAQDIEKIVSSVRDNFVNYIGKLSQKQSNKILWYSSCMASKSISQTSIFHQYVYLKLLEQFAKTDSHNIVVVTDDVELLENIQKIKIKNIIVLSNGFFFMKKLCARGKGYLKTFRYILLWYIAKVLRNPQLNRFDVFIHTWIDERTFSNLPHFTDPYLGDLGDVLTREGAAVARLIFPSTPLKYLLKLPRHFTDIVYPLSYLTLSDLLKNILRRFSITVNDVGGEDMKDVEILGVLVNNEIVKENRSRTYLDYLIAFYSYKSMNGGIKPDSSLIYPFENQPWEKMLNLAFGHLNRVAYQHTAIPYNCLDYHSSMYEEMPLPQTILTVGRKWFTFLKQQYPAVVIEDAGAIRFSYLFHNKHNMSSGKNIIVALPISPSIAIALQRQILRVLGNISLGDYIIKIKPHPRLKKNAVLEKEFTQYKNCQFVNQSIHELLKECMMLVTSGSAVTFESLLLGRKTLYFLPEEISWGLEHFVRDSLCIADEDDFLEQFRSVLDSACSPNVNIDEYFSPSDYTVFLKHIHTKKHSYN